MPVPDIVDLDPASDARFRDVYGRHHNRMMTRSGNLIRTTYHHVSGAQANVSAAEVVSVDASENAQYDLILRNATAPIALANLTSANINTWSASSLLSLRQGTTSIRSANVAVGNVMSTDRVSATTYYASGGQKYMANNAPLLQGSYYNWNTLSTGSSDFVNKSGLGNGGFFFYNSSGSGSTTRIDDSTLLVSMEPTGLEVQQNVYSANVLDVFSATTGPRFFYRQVLQPCVFRGTAVVTPSIQSFAAVTVGITGGPYVTDLLTCMVVVSNGDYGANTGFYPMNGSVQTLVSNQVTQIRVLYTSDNTNPARINYAIFFTPR
jgi:hypothetical protein